ncbi:rhodanese-like domain-containing protein [Sulfurimonas sp.]|nr:rhodanese-like domain-containing protein [Sulfurimonas sp.]
MKLFLVLLLSVVSILFAGNTTIHPGTKLINEATKNTKAISPKELKKLIDEYEDVILLDVREIMERSEGEIYADNSYAMTRGILELYILTKIKDTNALIVTYCRAGTKGVLAAQTLKQMGYKDARYLDGGLRAWVNAGYPIETGLGTMKLVID